MKPVEKVFAYVTHRGRLLLLLHPDHPEAGVQVPAGTLEVDEAPEVGVLREVREETGLEAVEAVKLLGVREMDMRPFGREETHRRWFFHVRCTEDVPETWRHWEEDPSER